ncbi:MAG: DNA topoisomerase (ATP-hydrolyzing) subunit A [Mycoplasmoidaceae bacterium]|nr:MAG: DNA topoisomerase (ATP-hydrolyzing) subunit A [Mycoplasmoidaceae bacterium]
MSNKTVSQIKDELAQTKILDQPIAQELQNSFLEYAMSVIVARALPDARDGFKPVHRRVLFAAYGLGLSSDKPHKKSARIVGEVIGKYHPHGDTAAYETMVRMAQNFSMRYPLIDGHGNFGSTDDGAAAMRYTEARLSKIGDLVLEDIEKDTVKYVDNYDGSEKEPEVLTCALPNMLANGSNGIAVGMATNIPPHNLNELTEAIKLLSKNPDVDIEEIRSVLHGPDFPTGAEIIGVEGIHNYFKTGHGSVMVRSKIAIEYLDSGKSIIRVTELPYMVSKKNLIDKICELVKEKKVEGIADLQDYSSRDGINIEISTKKDVVPEVLLNQLYKTTPLQTSFAINMLALVNGEPKVLNIKQSLEIYLAHQIDMLVKKTIFEKTKAEARAHILEGLHIATTNIDDIIKIIKNAKDNDDAIKTMMDKYKIDEIQGAAITEMKLRSLTGLERGKIEAELEKLREYIKECQSIIESKEKQITIVCDTLDKINKKFGDERRTVIRTDITSDIDDEDLIPKEDILITMSKNGYLKRLPIDTYTAQHRGGVGVIGAKTQGDDDVHKIIAANTHTDLLIFSDLGKVYRIRGHQVPLGNKLNKGIPAINIIGIEKNENILTILPIDTYGEDSKLFFCTRDGIVKQTNLIEFERINKSGKIAITLKEGDKLYDVLNVKNGSEIYIGASNGQLVRFEENQVRTMGRTAAGVGGMDLDPKEFVVGLSSSEQGKKILSIGEKGAGKLTDVEEYRKTKRNAKGVKTLKVSSKTGKLIYISAVNGDEDALMITTKGKVIRFALSEVNTIGRSTSGVKLMNIDDNEKLQSVTMFKKGDLGEQEEGDGVIVAKTKLIDIE